MKKTLCACMAAVLALASLPVLGASAEETTYALGDVDMDGVVTNDDATMISRYVLGYITLTEEQLKLADVNEDGTVDQADADKLYTEMQVYPLGDVDMNGNAGVSDAVDILTYCAKVSAGQSMELTAVQKNLTDVDLNGKISVDDACYNYIRRDNSLSLSQKIYHEKIWSLCSIIADINYLNKKDCFFKLKEYPEGNGHDTGGFREWIL